ncbi:hypothetical protein COP1_007742 [Malus domestica]
MLLGTRAMGPVTCTRQQNARLLGQSVLSWPKDQHGLCAMLLRGLEEMDRCWAAIWTECWAMSTPVDLL